MNAPFYFCMEKFLHAINSVKGCHWTILDILWKAFHDWAYVWQQAELEDLMRAGCGEKFAGRLVDLRLRFESAFSKGKVQHIHWLMATIVCLFVKSNYQLDMRSQ